MLLYGESKYQEARKFSIVCFNRDFLETRNYPNPKAIEVLLGIPPTDIVVQNISDKFLRKVLQYHDHLRKPVFQQKNLLPFIIILLEEHIETILQSEK